MNRFLTTRRLNKVGVKPVTFLENPPRYCSFILTLWEERSQDPAAPPVWRFRLEIARTGERRGFATLKDVMVYLEDHMCDGDRTKAEGDNQHTY
jgi:hypothetical protein